MAYTFAGSLFAYILVLAHTLSAPPERWLPVMAPMTVAMFHVLADCLRRLGGEWIHEAHSLPLPDLTAPPHEHRLVPVNLVTHVGLMCRECGCGWHLTGLLRLLDWLLPVGFCAGVLLAADYIDPETVRRCLVQMLFAIDGVYGLLSYTVHRLVCRYLKRQEDLRYRMGKPFLLDFTP